MTLTAEPTATVTEATATVAATAAADVAVAVDPEVLAFYTDQCDEAARLTSSIRGRLESIRIRELLRPHLPAAPGPVADIGGGPGVHAVWLQSRGYTVDLLDPIPPPHRDRPPRRSGIGSGR